jgi:hypothetical protein
VLAFQGIRVFQVERDEQHGWAVLTVRPRLPAKVGLVEFAAAVNRVMLSMKLRTMSSEQAHDGALPRGTVHVRAEYDASDDKGEVFILGMEDAMLPRMTFTAQWMRCDVDADRGSS